jgi:uncharacterized protein (TIGR02452 family)
MLDTRKTNFLFWNCDSISASEKFKNNVCILNFASAKHAGGGFSKGQRTGQEEQLCMQSDLYEHLKVLKIYDLARKDNNDCLYHDFVVFTPDVEVNKDFKASFITCPAPNAGVARTKGVSESEILKTIKRRIETIIMIAENHGVKNLVLGAFGCGVFQNNEKDVALAFRMALKNTHFDNVIFAIPNKRVLGIFKNI